MSYLLTIISETFHLAKGKIEAINRYYIGTDIIYYSQLFDGFRPPDGEGSLSHVSATHPCTHTPKLAPKWRNTHDRIMPPKWRHLQETYQ